MLLSADRIPPTRATPCRTPPPCPSPRQALRVRAARCRAGSTEHAPPAEGGGHKQTRHHANAGNVAQYLQALDIELVQRMQVVAAAAAAATSPAGGQASRSHEGRCQLCVGCLLLGNGAAGAIRQLCQGAGL